MKTPPKPFVVEIKSGRRRSHLQPKSIWAGTDFKALVREARSDAPHLFSPADIQEPLAVSEQQPLNARPATGRQESDAAPPGEDLDARPIIADEALPMTGTARPVEGAQATQKAATFVSLDINPPQPTSQARLSKRPPRRHAATTRISRRVTIDACTSGVCMSGVVDALDDIERLTRENQRLKTLRVAQLRQQNRWLSEALSRFAPNADG